MTGLLVRNDFNNLQISSDSKSLSYKNVEMHDFNTNNVQLPVHPNDGSFNVWHRPDAESDITYIGLYQGFYGGATYIGRRELVMPSTLQVWRYSFSPQTRPSTGIGIQLFDATGNEVYNSDCKLLNIIDKVSFNVADSYDKEIFYNEHDGTYGIYRTKWSKRYPNKSKLGLLFTNVPAGISKTSSMAQIWAYFYFFRTNGDTVEIEYRPQYWSWSGTSATIPLDVNLKFEFFVVDLSHI